MIREGREWGDRERPWSKTEVWFAERKQKRQRGADGTSMGKKQKQKKTKTHLSGRRETWRMKPQTGGVMRSACHMMERKVESIKENVAEQWECVLTLFCCGTGTCSAAPAAAAAPRSSSGPAPPSARRPPPPPAAPCRSWNNSKCHDSKTPKNLQKHFPPIFWLNDTVNTLWFSIYVFTYI